MEQMYRLLPVQTVTKIPGASRVVANIYIWNQGLASYVAFYRSALFRPKTIWRYFLQIHPTKMSSNGNT